MNFPKCIIALLLVIIFGFFKAETLLPCALQWVSVIDGEVLPENSFQINTETDEPFIFIQGIIRSMQLGNYSIDAANVTKSYYKDFIAVNDEARPEVLTNPCNCSLEWVPVTTGKLMESSLVSTGNNGNYIGSRKLDRENDTLLFPFSFTKNRGGNHCGENCTIVLLQSTKSPQLEIHIHEMINEQTSASYQVVSTECQEIRNYGAESVARTYTFSTDDTTTTSMMFGGGLDLNLENLQLEVEFILYVMGGKIFILSISGHVGLFGSLDMDLTFKTDKSERIENSGQVFVRGGEGVQICLSSIKKFDTTTATCIVTFTNPCLSAETVNKLIPYERFKKIRKLDDSRYEIEMVVKHEEMFSMPTATMPLNRVAFDGKGTSNAPFANWTGVILNEKEVQQFLVELGNL